MTTLRECKPHYRVYTGFIPEWYSLLLPDDGQVPKRCKNNGTGSDVMCSAMGMGVSTRNLFTDEAAGSLSPSSDFIPEAMQNTP